MSNGKQSIRRLSTGLIAAGVVLILVIAGYLVLNQLRGAQTRRDLAQPTATATSVPVAQAIVPTTTVTPAQPATTAPTPTLVTPEPTQPAATATATIAAITSTSPEPPRPTATPAPVASAVPIATTMPASAPVHLAIPDLKIDVPVVEMGWRVVQTANGPRSDWVIPKNEAGHHINSAELGEEGNVVISGHNNIYGQVFKPISFAWDNDASIKVDNFTDRSELLNGKSVELFDAAGQEFKYTITAFYRLKDTGVSIEQRIANGRFMEPTDQTQVTIITCWPPTSNTHRLVIVAVPATN